MEKKSKWFSKGTGMEREESGVEEMKQTEEESVSTLHKLTFRQMNKLDAWQWHFSY